jgi:cell division protein FtsW (lipid II flippase)
MATLAALIVYKIPIKAFENNKFIIAVSIGALILQLLVFVPGIWSTFNGARGWIRLGGLTTIQPAEFFKVAYILFVSSWFIRKRNHLQSSKLLTFFIILNGLVFLLFGAIPDLWSFLVMIRTGLILCWYAGVRLKHIVVAAGVLGIAGTMFVSIASLLNPNFRYITDRFTYFIRSDIDPEMRQIGWQNQQALIAIGWGWFWWQGYGKGLQKFGFIPEAQSDFIFAAFSEEIGFVGNLILLGLYVYLVRYFLSNLHRVHDEHSKLIGVGIISLIIIQMFVNIGVNLKIIPNTGLTLPFISYGGTAIMVNMIQSVFLYKILARK